jgi:SAM-dependent methyltransferase
MAVATQRDAVQGTLFGFIKQGLEQVQTGAVVDTVLAQHQALFSGQTPRNSVRRTLTDLQSDGLVIKDGRGYLKIRVGELVNTVVKGDVKDLLALCPDNSLNLVHADAPWKYMLAHLSKGANTRMLGSGTSWFEMGDLPKEVIVEIYRVLKPGGVFFCWMPPMQEESFDTWHEVLNDLYVTGFKLIRQVKWIKGKGPGYLWAADGEPCLILSKNTRPKFYDLTITDTIEVARLSPDEKFTYTDYEGRFDVQWDNIIKEFGSHKKALDAGATLPPTKHHSCEKPVSMLMRLLRPVVKGEHGEAPAEDKFLLDLYSGTGSASEAIHRLGGTFCAVELDPRNLDHLVVPRLGARVKHILDLESNQNSSSNGLAIRTEFAFPDAHEADASASEAN